MNRNEFDTGMAALFAGFAYAAERTTRATEDVYFEMLKEIPADMWMAGVKHALSQSTYFPSIHDLGAACCGETLEHDEERCDPLRFKQNYTVHIEPVTWQQNLAAEMKRRTALPAPAKQRAISPNQEVAPVVSRPFDAKDYFERVWSMQDNDGFASINNPPWYKKKRKGWMTEKDRAEVDALVAEPPF